MLRPASPGTGVIAGGAVRAVVEVAGIRDILTKCIGTSNTHNVIHATIDALRRLESSEDVARRRGVSVEQVLSGQRRLSRGATARDVPSQESVAMATKLKVTQIRSGVRPPRTQRLVLQGLGLRGPHTLGRRSTTRRRSAA